MINKHERYMREALKQAELAFEKGEVPVGTIVIYREQIIARAYNQIKMLKDPTAHAEMIAITQAAAFLKSERLKDCDMYVTIEPCSMCAGAMVLARIRNLYFATEDPKSGAAGSVVDILHNRVLNHRVNAIPGILREESRTLIQAFFKGNHKKTLFIALFPCSVIRNLLNFLQDIALRQGQLKRAAASVILC